MKYFLKETIYLIPIMMLVVSFLSAFIDLNYVVAGNLIGYSIITNIVFFYIFYYGNYCWFTKLAPIGLILINIVDIIGFYLPKYYSFWYAIIIFSVILTLTLIFELNKRIFK